MSITDSKFKCLENKKRLKNNRNNIYFQTNEIFTDTFCHLLYFHSPDPAICYFLGRIYIINDVCPIIYAIVLATIYVCVGVPYFTSLFILVCRIF